MSKHYQNMDALEIIKRERQKGIADSMEVFAKNSDTPGTFGEMQLRLQSHRVFLQNEKADALKRIDEYKDVYHPDRIAKSKKEAIESFEKLGARMVSKAKEEVKALCEAKAANIRLMVVKEPTAEQIRLLEVLEKRRGNVSHVEFVNVMSSMYGNYQALMALSVIAGDSGMNLSVPAQYNIPDLYSALEVIKDYLLGACDELSKDMKNGNIRYNAFYTTGGDGENNNHHDPHYRELAAMFDTIPQLRDIEVSKTALTPTEEERMNFLFSDVKALQENEYVNETEILRLVEEVVKSHRGDVELMKLTPYKEYIEKVLNSEEV